MKAIKSLTLVKIQHPKLGIRWASRVRLIDGTEMFAGTDNVYGKSYAQACQDIVYRAVLNTQEGQELGDDWGPLPEGWGVVV
jgi:hypothetical protein